jgi:hypothetical protein
MEFEIRSEHQFFTLESTEFHMWMQKLGKLHVPEFEGMVNEDLKLLCTLLYLLPSKQTKKIELPKSQPKKQKLDYIDFISPMIKIIDVSCFFFYLF